MNYRFLKIGKLKLKCLVYTLLLYIPILLFLETLKQQLKLQSSYVCFTVQSKLKFDMLFCIKCFYLSWNLAINVTYDLYSTKIKKCLGHKVEDTLLEFQGVFLEFKSTTDKICILNYRSKAQRFQIFRTGKFNKSKIFSIDSFSEIIYTIVSGLKK